MRVAKSAIAAEAARVGAEVRWLDEFGVRTDCTAGTSDSPRGRTRRPG